MTLREFVQPPSQWLVAIVAAIVVAAIAWTLFHTISAEGLLAPSQGENGGHDRWLLSLNIGALVVALILSQGLLVIAVWRSRREELRRREADALGERQRRQIAELQSTEESLRASCRELEGRMAKGMSDFAWASQRLVEVQDDEARRIAHELHDDVGQALAATRLGLHAIQRGSPPPETVSNCIRSIQHVIDVVRDVTVSLRPPVLDDLGLVPALRWHIERLRQSSNFEIDLRAPEPKNRLPREVENAGFRIVQEALNNISEHAHARHVVVELRLGGHGATLSIRDDGTGFDVAAAALAAKQSGSFGLIGMQERALHAGGEVEIASQPGRTEVRARFHFDTTAPP